MKALTFKKGGIHVPENKYTPADRIIDVELPMKVVVTLKQHIGMPAVPIVKKGDHVTRGQKIAEAQGRISAPVHASISGTVEKIDLTYITSGLSETAIFIAANDEDHASDEAARHTSPVPRDWHQMRPDEIIATIADSGIVGLGGATFPAAMKLSPPPDQKAELLIINAAECEPYLTCDDALMRAHAPEIVTGIEIMLKASNTPAAVIGIEDNKPEAINALTNATDSHANIRVQILKTKYPQGGEKQLINAITSLEVPSGALPINVGVIVNNVATAYAIYRAIVERTPLIDKVITIAGHGNYRVPIGINISSLPIVTEQAEIADVIIGGPMMGRSAATLDAPVEKGTSGVTPIVPLPFDPQPCIRCGECVQACPMGLEPYLISTYGRLRRIDDAVAQGALDCIECGSCNYSCPSARPILDYIRLAKTSYRNRPKK